MVRTIFSGHLHAIHGGRARTTSGLVVPAFVTADCRGLFVVPVLSLLHGGVLAVAH